VSKLRKPLKFAVDLNIVCRPNKPQRGVARRVNSLLPLGYR
jgi:hypothetical protein